MKGDTCESPNVSAKNATTHDFVQEKCKIFNLDMLTESRRLRHPKMGPYWLDPRKEERVIHTRSGWREAVVFVLMREDRWLRQQHVHFGVDAGESPPEVMLS